MKFTNAALSAFLLSVGGVAAFTSNKPSRAFVARSTPTKTTISTATGHSIACACPSCRAAMHPVGCPCASCNKFALYSTAVDEESSTATEPDDIPAEVEALDGINSEEEAHNAERPARKSLKAKKSKGKPLSEFSVGDTITAKAKAITSYGAFMDIGAETDGLLHISNLSTDFVSDVKDVLEEGKEYDVRIISIDEGKGQIGLSLLTKEEEDSAQQQQRAPRRERQPRANARKDDSALLAKLKEVGWDETKFVEGTVVNTVDFGAFVSVDCSQFSEEIEGSIDGLVHISAMANNRVGSVSDVVKTDDKVQVRLKSIDKRKVSLSMVSAEDEKAKMEARGGGGPDSGPVGNTEWKASLKELQNEMPEFKNSPMVIDNREN